MTTYIILRKNELDPHIIVETVLEPKQQDSCCQKPIHPSTPITTIFSCHEPRKEPEIMPFRSTFCFPQSTMKFKSSVEILELKHQWNTFERIENINSIVQNNLANQLPVEASSGPSEPAFYQFTSSEEKTAYNLGQLAHTISYPDVTDFLVPYSAKPIQYTSTVISTLIKKIYPPIPSTSVCSNVVPPKPPLNNDVLLRNKNGLNLYVRVSTQIAQFPKSPYKFKSNNEYITYNEYKKLLC
jgi:hypothetical protein